MAGSVHGTLAHRSFDGTIMYNKKIVERCLIWSYDYVWSLYYSKDRDDLLLENIVMKEMVVLVEVVVVVVELDLRNLNELESVMHIVVVDVAVAVDYHSTSVEEMNHLNLNDVRLYDQQLLF